MIGKLVTILTDDDRILRVRCVGCDLLEFDELAIVPGAKQIHKNFV
jgi:hypothetical protein